MQKLFEQSEPPRLTRAEKPIPGGPMKKGKTNRSQNHSMLAYVRTPVSFTLRLVPMLGLLLLPGVFVARAFAAPAVVTPLKTCPAEVSTTQNLVLQPNGSIVQAQSGLVQVGASQEAPACIHIVFNPIRFELTVSDKVTLAAGVNPTSVLTTGTAPTAAAGISDELQKLQQFVNQQITTLSDINKTLSDLKSFVTNVDAAIASNGSQGALIVASTQYKSTIFVDLVRLSTDRASLLPSDLTAGTCTAALTAPVPSSLADRLAKLQPQIAASLVSDTAVAKTAAALIDKDNDAVNKATDATLKAAAQDTLTKDQSASTNAQKQVDLDNAEIALVTDMINKSNQLKCGSPGLQAVNANLGILDFWTLRLASLGFGMDGGNPTVPAKNYRISCGGLFNQSATHVLSASFSDELPTLNGGTATAASTPQTFFTATCSAPVVVSVGVEFSGIPDQEYKIVAAQGPNNTTVNEFGYATNSAFHVLPLVAANFRILEPETYGRRWAFYGTVGVSGNLQGQSSGGSSAEFLLGPSVSLFRTLFVTAGAHVGYRSTLSGGYKVGDTVPSSITSPAVYKSATVSYGIAITFGKP
jgi:hypothetical protein